MRQNRNALLWPRERTRLSSSISGLLLYLVLTTVVLLRFEAQGRISELESALSVAERREAEARDALKAESTRAASDISVASASKDDAEARNRKLMAELQRLREDLRQTTSALDDSDAALEKAREAARAADEEVYRLQQVNKEASFEVSILC